MRGKPRPTKAHRGTRSGVERSRALKVFPDVGAHGRSFVVHLEQEAGKPHLTVARASYLDEDGRVDEAEGIELFRVNNGNGFVSPTPAAITTGLIGKLRDAGLLGSGRMTGDWQGFLTGE